MSWPSLRHAAFLVAVLNLAYFGVEFAVALAIGSVSLFADSIDFLEDASVNLLIVMALGWSAASRARTGMALAGAGAIAINLTCALLLARHRSSVGSLAKAAYLSARNDVAANLAIVAAGLATAWLWHSVWPDLIVGLAIAVMNADAAREVWEAAWEEHRDAKS